MTRDIGWTVACVSAAAEAYEHSIRLAEELDDEIQLFRSRFGTWHLSNVKGDARSAKRIADTLLQQAGHTAEGKDHVQYLLRLCELVSGRTGR